MGERDRPLVLPRRMTDAEALMWAIEKDPALRSAFVNVTLFDRAPDPARLRRRMERAVRLVPRLRQRVVAPPARLGPPVWADDPSFDLDHHVRRVAVPAPGDDRTFLDLVARLSEDAFDRARPLWQFWLVEGLSGGRAALVQKLHHTITDGVGGARLSLLLVDLSPDAPDPGPEDVEDVADTTAPAGIVGLAAGALATRARRLGGSLASAASAATSPSTAVRLPGEIVAAAASVRRQVLLHGARSPLWRGKRSLRRHLELLSFDLDEAKAAGKALGGSLNDVWVTGVAGGAGAYHRAMGTVAPELRMAMPVSTRSDRSAGGNAFGLSRVLVPAGERDPVARFEAVRARLARSKTEPVLAIAQGAAGLLALLPTGVLVPFARQQAETVDFATSNVRGSPVELWLCGARITGVHPMGPTMGAACNATMFSYGGSLDVGLAVDPAAVADPGLLARCIAEGVDEVLAAGRRRPDAQRGRATA